MKLNLVYAERDTWYDLIKEAVQSILGVTIDKHSRLTGGILMTHATRYESGGFYQRESAWRGVVLSLSFRGYGYIKIHRSLLIKPDGILDEAKLRQKWAEILALKAEDDLVRERKGKAEQRRKETMKTTKDALEAQGIDKYLMSVEPSSDGTVSVNIRGLSVETVAEIAAIVQKSKTDADL